MHEPYCETSSFGAALEPIGFAVIESDHLHWDDHVVGRVLYDWASPEINWELTPENVRMFRRWLAGEVKPLPEPKADSVDLSGAKFVGRTFKAWSQPGEKHEAENDADGAV